MARVEGETTPVRITPLHTCVAGRARIKVAGLGGSAPTARLLEQGLEQHRGVTSASASELTGNVTVLFDPALGVDAVVDRIATLLRGEPGSGFGSDGAPCDWHVLAADEVRARQGTSLGRGLAETEAQRRFSQLGANELRSSSGRSPEAILADQFTTPPAALLAGAAVVSLLTGALLEAAAIAAVLAVNGAIGFVTESQAERAVRALGRSAPKNAQVVRDGTTREIPARSLVPGDLLLVTRGTVIPADARVVAERGLAVSESALTGEGRPVRKSAEPVADGGAPLAERVDMLYRGTVVTSGSGSAIVVATGRETEVGRVQRLVDASRPPATPTHRQLSELGARLAWLTGGASLLLLALGRLHGFGMLQMVRSALSLAVAAVPEGLPMIATTTHALGVDALRKRQILVRRMSAIETLASVDVVCFDKTGTLTENRMSVAAVACGDRTAWLEDGRLPLPLDDGMRRLLEIGSLCNEAEPSSLEGEAAAAAFSTEAALLDGALKSGIDVEGLRRRHPALGLRQRTEAYRFMVTTHRHESGVLIAMKGSPEEVLARCSRALGPGGEIHPLTAERRRAVETANAELAGRSLRVLGFAYAAGRRRPDAADPPRGLTWVGLAGLRDRLRPGVRQLLGRLHRAGVRTLMLTGDQRLTARSVAAEIGLAHEGEPEVAIAADLDRLAPAELMSAIDRAHVFARVNPAQKLEIVRALQRAGAVVAMIGDGINDSPALRAADVGLAIGINGDMAAREVADVFLHAEDLAPIALAIEHGRTMHANIRKSLRFLLGTNASEIMLMLATTAAGVREVLTPVQLLWINLITDVLPGIGLALEAPDAEAMNRPPPRANAPLLGTEETRTLLGEGAVLAAGALAAGIYGAIRHGASSPQMRTLTFGSLVATQLLHATTCRSPDRGVFDGSLPPNRALDAILLGSVLVQAGAFLLPPLRRALGITPLGLLDFLVLLGTSALPFAANQLLAARRAPHRRDAAGDRRVRTDATIEAEVPPSADRQGELPVLHFRREKLAQDGSQQGLGQPVH